MPPTKHARYGPSKLEKKEQCPHFEYDQTGDSSAADEGTLCHNAVETRNLGILDTPEQIEQVEKCIMLEDSIIAHYGDGCHVFKEVKVTLEDLTYGTVDLLVISGDLKTATVLDWKFGRTPVTDADRNTQGQAYVAAVFETYPELETIELQIVCPRQDWSSACVYHRDPDLERIKLRVLSIIARADDPNIAPTPSSDACLRCGNKSTCTALHSIAENTGKALALPMVFDTINIISPSDQSKAMALSYILEDWAKQVRKRLTTAVLEEGAEVPGFKIRSREGTVSITEAYPVIELLLDRYDLDMTEILQACRLSYSELVNRILSASGGTDKRVIREELDSLIGDFLVRHDRITYLQREGKITNEEIISGQARIG